jgi:hypothetical protein
MGDPRKKAPLCHRRLKRCLIRLAILSTCLDPSFGFILFKSDEWIVKSSCLSPKSMRSSRLTLVLAGLITPALAGVQEVWWNVTYVQNANPDGLYERRVIGVNNTWPYDKIVAHICVFGLPFIFLAHLQSRLTRTIH